MYSLAFFLNRSGLNMQPSEEVTKKPCALVIRIQHPLKVQGDITKFLIARSIAVNSMHLHCINEREGTLVIHCMIEKDRIRYTVTQLEKIKGIIEMDVLESKGIHVMI
jgi:hypothetical protein